MCIRDRLKAVTTGNIKEAYKNDFSEGTISEFKGITQEVGLGITNVEIANSEQIGEHYNGHTTPMGILSNQLGVSPEAASLLVTESAFDLVDILSASKFSARNKGTDAENEASDPLFDNPDYKDLLFHDRNGKVGIFHDKFVDYLSCLLYTSPSPRDRQKSRMPSSA